MGKAYSADSREKVRALLEQGKDEELIERETGVSDRTIRRWKLELERFGRIGKPPESRTGRHRVMGPDVEQALFEHVAQKPDMSVDDMLWWLYDRYKLVVGTRTIRRAFERRNTSHKKFKTSAQREQRLSKGGESVTGDEGDLSQLQAGDGGAYQSPYAPMAPMGNDGGDISPDLARALAGLPGNDSNIHPDLIGDGQQLSEDEETLQLQLQQIALQKREVELKLKMRRLQRAKNGGTPSGSANVSGLDDSSLLFDTNVSPGASAAQPTPSNKARPKGKPRDSRSKNKIEEARKRTEERQERMLRDLEKRSRRREHLTAEWVQSKDIWPVRAQQLLQDLMHRYSTYAYNQNSLDTFEAIFRELYQLVDHSDWYPPVHDDLLRERTRRKMSQLRSKMVKAGEIISRGEGYGGWTKAEGDANGGAPPDMGQHNMGQNDMHMPDMQQLGMDLGQDPGAHDGHAPDPTMMSQDPMMHQHPSHPSDQDMHPDMHQDILQQHQQALAQQGMLAHGDVGQHGDVMQVGAYPGPGDLQQQQQDLARQHEMLAQQGIAQQEQMAHQLAM